MKECVKYVTSQILILAGRPAKIFIDFIFVSHYHNELVEFDKFYGSLMH
jgi:hypothetical protein